PVQRSTVWPSYHHLDVISKICPIAQHLDLLNITCPLHRDILHSLRCRRESLFSKRPPARNHEDHIFRHQTQDCLKIASFAGGQPDVDQFTNGPFVVCHRGSLATRILCKALPFSGCQAVDEPSQLIELHSRPHSPPAPAPIATPEIRSPPGSADGRTPRGMDGRPTDRLAALGALGLRPLSTTRANIECGNRDRCT